VAPQAPPVVQAEPQQMLPRHSELVQASLPVQTLPGPPFGTHWPELLQ
jgi:hypothetical protein